MKVAVQLRPLLVRPGARFACFGDGLCCTDLHLLGPLTRPEVKRLRMFDPAVVVRSQALDAHVLRTVAGGGCVFLDGGCALHRELGPMGKPTGCRRFPFRLVATPAGGRVITEHRCPCRTLGDRPSLSIEEAEASLRDDGGRLHADHRVGDRVKLARGKSVTFGSFSRSESRWLSRTLAGDDLVTALEATPFPDLAEASWLDLAHEYRSRIDGSACGDAMAWFGDVLLALAPGGRPLRTPRNRPWAPAFDRAQARSPNKRRAADVLSDWAADVLWSLDWTQIGSAAAGRAELVTRWTVAKTITERLRADGAREDRAAAEAVSIVEIVGAGGLWQSITKSIDRSLPR